MARTRSSSGAPACWVARPRCGRACSPRERSERIYGFRAYSKMGRKGAALLALGALATMREMAAAVDPNPVFPKVSAARARPHALARCCLRKGGGVARSRTRRATLQAWHADYDYVATGEITQDGNGTIGYATIKAGVMTIS